MLHLFGVTNIYWYKVQSAQTRWFCRGDGFGEFPFQLFDPMKKPARIAASNANTMPTHKPSNQESMLLSLDLVAVDDKASIADGIAARDESNNEVDSSCVSSLSSSSSNEQLSVGVSLDSFRSIIRTEVVSLSRVLNEAAKASA